MSISPLNTSIFYLLWQFLLKLKYSQTPTKEILLAGRKEQIFVRFVQILARLDEEKFKQVPSSEMMTDKFELMPKSASALEQRNASQMV